jgi:16S rRNA (cytidine1402-2'-O)-methyltransferase
MNDIPHELKDAKSAKPALLLLPNLLGDSRHHELFLPVSVDNAVGTIDGLIAESSTAGRRYLGRFNTKRPSAEIPIAVFNERTSDADIDFFLEPIRKGERWGVVSDAGLPCIADPGAKLVARARQSGIVVQAFVGPSALMLSLMLSGLPGQSFSFLGYLEKDMQRRELQLKVLEKRAKADSATQIFIETPYRNKHALETLLKILNDNTKLCVAWDLTLPTQGILSQKISLWKKCPLPQLEKKNAIFLFAC